MSWLMRWVRRSTALRRASARQAILVLAEELEQEVGVVGIVLGAVGSEGLAETLQRARIHGEEHDEVVLHQRGDQRPALGFQADAHVPAAEALAQPRHPLGDSLGGLRDAACFSAAGTGLLEAEVVVVIGPVDPDSCGEFDGFSHFTRSRKRGWKASTRSSGPAKAL